MRLLYIEDDPLNRRVVGDMLQVAGADMIEARDGLSALAAVERGNFAAALVSLGGEDDTDGVDLIRRIRSRRDRKARLPLLVFTPDPATEVARRCLAAGANEVLPKPVAMRDLFAALGRTLMARGRLFPGTLDSGLGTAASAT